MIILPAQLSELTGSSQANSTGSSVANSSPGSTQQDKQATRIQSTTCKTKQYDEMMICYAGCDAGCKMQDMTGNAWTWPQHENLSVPLERWDEIAWKRYKERRNRSYGLEMASDSKMTPVCDLQQVGIPMVPKGITKYTSKHTNIAKT